MVEIFHVAGNEWKGRKGKKKGRGAGPERDPYRKTSPLPKLKNITNGTILVSRRLLPAPKSYPNSP